MTCAAPVQLESLAALVSSKTGIIRRMRRRIGSADEPPVPIIYESQLSHFDFRTGSEIERGACGKGLTEAAAQIGAIGEAIEHYCAAHARVKMIRKARFSEIENAIPHSEFVLYSETQYNRPGFRFARWSSDAETGWLEARELPGQTSVWIPSGLVYLGYSGQENLCPPTSSGSAAGPDLERAILSGLLEDIERDAFVITWMNRLPAPTLDYSRLGGPCGVIRDYYARYGVEARAFLLPTDLPVCAVMAIGLDRSPGGPAAVVGLGCDLNPEVALRRALFEVCQMRPAERKKFAAGDAAKLNAYSDVHSLEDHALYFTRHDHLHELDFLMTSGAAAKMEELPDRSSSDTRRDLAFVTAALRDVGSRVVYCELTTPDLEGFPIRVVRALATQLQPIAFGHDMQRLGCSRLYELPRRLGYGTECRSEADLNPCPHPLA